MPGRLLLLGGLSAGHPRTPQNPLGLHPNWVGPAPDAAEWLLGLCFAQGNVSGLQGDSVQDVMLRQPAGSYSPPVSFAHGPCTMGAARWSVLSEVAAVCAKVGRRLDLYVGGWPTDACSLVHDPHTTWSRATLPWIDAMLRPWAGLGARLCGVDASSRGQQDRSDFEYVHWWCERNLGIGLMYEATPAATGGRVDWTAVSMVAGSMAIMHNFRVRLFDSAPDPTDPRGVRRLPWSGSPAIPLWRRLAWTVPSGCRALALVAPGDQVTALEWDVLVELGFELAFRNVPIQKPGKQP